jgi:dipeptidyl aminopeptidase/acylaminoacyl peptidase
MSRLLREVREVTVSETGEKVWAMVYLFPKEKFNAKEMFAVHAHGGDWRKFVMMPRFDGYEH